MGGEGCEAWATDEPFNLLYWDMPTFFNTIDRQPKIDQKHLIRAPQRIHQYIIRLEVPVNIALIMQSLDARKNLHRKFTDPLQGKQPWIIKIQLEKVQAEVVLHDEEAVIALLDVNDLGEGWDVF